MTRIIHTGLLLGLILAVQLFAGCQQIEQRATEQAYERSAQASARAERYPLCCESPAEIRYSPLARERITADFAPGFSQMRQFPTGRSYFIGVDLGKDSVPESLYFKTELMDMAWGQRATIMVPSLQFFDESFRLTRMPLEPRLCFYRGDRSDDTGYFARVNRIPESTRYVVVYADRSALRRPVQYTNSVTTSAGTVPITVTAQHEYPRSLEGIVQLWAGADRTVEQAIDEHCKWH